MPKFASAVDFMDILPLNLVVDDSSIADDAIAISKISGLQEALDAASSDAELDAVEADVAALQTDLATEVTDRTEADTALEGRIIVLEGASTGSDLTALEGRVDVVEADITTIEGVNTTQDGRLTAIETLNTTQDGRLDALETAAQDINNATQVELDALAGRVTTAETDINALEAADTALDSRLDTIEGTGAGSITAAVAAEQARAEGVETGLGTRITNEETARADADTALDSRLDALEAVDNLTQAEFGTFQTANTAAMALKADLVGGLVPKAQLPSIALVDVSVVPDIPARDALTADEGDVAVVQDGSGTFIYDGTTWVPLSSGADAATDAEVTAAVDAEAALRIAADNALDVRLDTLEAVDNATQAELDAAVGTINTTTSALDGRITTEVTDRTAADTQIRTDFATADTALQTAIDAEETRAMAEEAAIRADLTGDIVTAVDALTAGAGLTRTGDTFDVGGTADRITVTADAVDISSAYAGQSSITTLGTVTAGTWNAGVIDLARGGTGYAAADLAALKAYLGIGGRFSVSLPPAALASPTGVDIVHNLNSMDVIVQLRETASGVVIFGNVIVRDPNRITVDFDDSYMTAGTDVTVVIHS